MLSSFLSVSLFCEAQDLTIVVMNVSENSEYNWCSDDAISTTWSTSSIFKGISENPWIISLINLVKFNFWI